MFVYEESGRIIECLKNKKGSIKSLVLASKYKNKKQLFALVCETLKYSEILDQIIESSRLRKQEKVLRSRCVTQVLLYDFLLGKGIHGDGKYKLALNKHKAALNAELARLKIRAKAVNNDDLLSDKVKSQVRLPRYVRVNLLKTNVTDVVQHFRSQGYVYHGHSHNSDYPSFLGAIQSLEKRHFLADYHMADQLLVFAPGTDLHDHVLYRSGDIILQDKASCLPAFILSPPTGSHVMDCCAAPGNKTSHAAAIMHNKGKIFAFDLDARRLSTMNTLLVRAGVTCVTLRNQDFLSVDPADGQYRRVEYLIVDPSCSGSGIVSRQDHLMGEHEDRSSKQDRLQSLATFQIRVLTHALSFPAARRVVYSTCSIHQQENEQVVRDVLQECGDRFELEHALTSWENRGSHDLMPEAARCIRAAPDSDRTNGFFVACFVRKKECDGGSRDQRDAPGLNTRGTQNTGSVGDGGKGNSTIANKQTKRKHTDDADETEINRKTTSVTDLSANTVSGSSSKKKKKKKKKKVQKKGLIEK